MEYLIIMLEGLASFISPCVLPILPVYISYFAGQDMEKGKKAIINSIGFVLGFTIIFVLLGVFANQLRKISKSKSKIYKYCNWNNCNYSRASLYWSIKAKNIR